jgi:hypothetical protein
VLDLAIWRSSPGRIALAAPLPAVRADGSTGTRRIDCGQLDDAADHDTGSDYTIDSFPEEDHSPIGDHGDYIDVMSDALMARFVSCINSDQQCVA